MFSNSLVWLSFACCRGEYVPRALLPFDFNCSVSETCYCSALTKYWTGGAMLSGGTISMWWRCWPLFKKVLPAFSRLLAFFPLVVTLSALLWEIYTEIKTGRFCVAIPVLPWQRFMMEFWNSCFTLAMTYDGIWNVPLSLATCDSCRISYLLGGLFVILQLKILVCGY